MAGIDFDCAYCGEHHRDTDGSASSPWPALAFRRPDPYLDLDTHARRFHARATDDLCVIDRDRGPDCYVRVTLSIPIRDEEITLEYGPWASVGEGSYLDYVEHYEDPDHREHYAGQLATAIPGYSHPFSVPVQVITRGMQRPVIVPDSTFGHALVRDFYDGISRTEAELRIRSMLLPSTPL
ncbi:DUF2199 domain-containing protein [Brachybacterium sacelli]|uniref:DUF2199 domain-containing protein n=1 Tax=Brachybacterium sacelli TaxID=173364 RepID=A0ABS4X630_9MICO|nr:DUF2199 domain-containing protein [Brachybacterium sacelli]MBP2383929.1 hypothetical protein [Brachybacterium sacelli]